MGTTLDALSFWVWKHEWTYKFDDPLKAQNSRSAGLFYRCIKHPKYYSRQTCFPRKWTNAWVSQSKSRKKEEHVWIDSRNVYCRNSIVIVPLTRGAKGNPITFLVVCEHNSNTDFSLTVPSWISVAFSSLWQRRRQQKKQFCMLLFWRNRWTLWGDLKILFMPKYSSFSPYSTLQVSTTSLIKSVGNPCRDVLKR